MHAVLARHLLDQRAEFLDLGAQCLGIRSRCRAEAVDARGKTGNVFANILGEILVFGKGADVAQFAAHTLHLARNAFGEFVLQFLSQVDECFGHFAQRCIALRGLCWGGWCARRAAALDTRRFYRGCRSRAIGRNGGGGTVILIVITALFLLHRVAGRLRRFVGVAAPAVIERLLTAANFIDGIESARAWFALGTRRCGRALRRAFGRWFATASFHRPAQQVLKPCFQAFDGAIERVQRRSVTLSSGIRSQSAHLAARFVFAV